MTERLSPESDLDDLIALYALGALDDADRAKVERRLATDARARTLLDEMRETVGALHSNVASVEPPARAKTRVLSRVDASLYSMALSKPPNAVQRLLQMLWPVLAVASLTIAIGVGTWAISLQQQLTQAQHELAIVQAPGVRVAALTPVEAAPQTAQISFIAAPNTQRGLLTVAGLPQVAVNQTYQFWLLKDGQPVPAGLLSVDASGSGKLIVTASEAIGNYQQAGLTVEPAGGSASPTLANLITLGQIN
jgi:anti-sigma-K factor RskA